MAAGGGSAIDAVKAAAIIASIGDIEPEIDPFFGVGAVSGVCSRAQRSIMPVPLHAGLVDDYMAPILEAAWNGDFSKIESM